MNSFVSLLTTVFREGRAEKQLRRIHRNRDYVIEFSDFAQEVFLRCVARRHTFAGETPGQLLAWMKQIARRIWVDQVRKSSALKRAPPGSATVDPEQVACADAATNPVSATIAREETERMLSELDDHERAIILGFYGEQRTLREISLRLGISYRRVSYLHSGALRKIRDVLGLGTSQEF